MPPPDPLADLQTEARNPASARLDELTSVELVALMSAEDATVPAAVATQSREIAQAVDAIAARLAAGGRLIYVGAGTSGRLGVVDASECPPTFQTPPEAVVGLIAGGRGAMFQAVEGAEDSPQLGEQDLRDLALAAGDVVCGIAASGRTPYVLGAVGYAKSVGAFTVGVACNAESPLGRAVDLAIAPVVGPEVLSGSTRLKAGTATKLVLNMLTTGAMVRLGKAFGNLMVDLKASNEKLKVRANRIVRAASGADAAEAEALLTACGGEVKTAIVAKLTGLSPELSRQRLADAGGRIKPAVGGLAAAAATAPVAGRGSRSDLVLGIDGGGTNTVTLLADAATGAVLGRGAAGPSNIQSVGVPTALGNLDAGIDRAFAAAGLPRATVGAVALGLAGVDRREGHDVIAGWVARGAVAHQLQTANDATLLLAAGTPAGWGLAVIAGTGSIAFAKSESGETGRAGGWGYTLGDEGSAYLVALRGLRAACRAADRAGDATDMVPRFLARMNLAAPPDLIPAIYRGPWDRAAIAGMAPVVLDAAAAGDAVAAAIVREEAADLARTAAAAARNLGLPPALPVALAGGLLVGSAAYRAAFLAALAALGVTPAPAACVESPALGAVAIARRLLDPARTA